MQVERIPDEDMAKIRFQGEANFTQITPHFQHMRLLDENASRREGKPVYKMHEVVELRFAGDNKYKPVMPTDKVYKYDGIREITYAERWPLQYQQFINGDNQLAEGTPLEELTSYGITPSQLSLCRALNVHSIETLDAVEGKKLGMASNHLKEMARLFLTNRASGGAGELAKLRAELASNAAELAALKSQIVPKEAPTEDDAAEALEAADAEFETMSQSELRDYIKSKVGAIPQGNFSRERLVQMAGDAKRDTAA